MEETLNNNTVNSAWNQSTLFGQDLRIEPWTRVEDMHSAAADRTAPIKEIVESMNELVKRNEEKRKAIMELQSRIEKLNQENRALKIKLKSGGEEAEKYCSVCTKYSENQRTYSQLARLKSLIFGSLVGGGSD